MCKPESRQLFVLRLDQLASLPHLDLKQTDLAHEDADRLTTKQQVVNIIVGATFRHDVNAKPHTLTLDPKMATVCVSVFVGAKVLRRFRLAPTHPHTETGSTTQPQQSQVATESRGRVLGVGGIGGKARK